MRIASRDQVRQCRHKSPEKRQRHTAGKGRGVCTRPGNAQNHLRQPTVLMPFHNPHYATTHHPRATFGMPLYFVQKRPHLLLLTSHFFAWTPTHVLTQHPQGLPEWGTADLLQIKGVLAHARRIIGSLDAWSRPYGATGVAAVLVVLPRSLGFLKKFKEAQGMDSVERHNAAPRIMRRGRSARGSSRHRLRGGGRCGGF